MLLHRRFLAVLGLCVLMLSGLTLLSHSAEKKPAPQWPTFRGSALQTGTRSEALPHPLKQIWTTKVGDAIEGAAAVVDGVVYVGSYDKHLYAFSLKDGTKKWAYNGGAFFIAPAAVHNGAVYVGDDDGKFHCIDAKSGKVKWTKAYQADVSSGAAFSKDSVLFGTGDESLHCLSLDKGEPRWPKPFRIEGGPVKATPTVVGDRTFVAGCDSALHVVDIKKGTEISSVALEGQVGATGAVDGDRLFLGLMTDEVVCIDFKKSKIEWSFRPKQGRQPFYASVALTDKYVVAGCRNRNVYLLDRMTGKEVWSFRTGDSIEGSPVVAGERIYVPSMDGHLYVLNVKDGSLAQKIKLDAAIYASPALADGRLIISTEKGTVYCFGK